MKKLFTCFISIILALTCVFSLSACNKGNDNATICVVDLEGTTVIVSKNVNRVACISQSATDLMITFGLDDKIVVTYRSFTYNKWTTEIYPQCANYKPYSYSVLAEILLADGIDLVIIQDKENAESFRNSGIPVVAVHQYSPTGVFDEEVYEIATIISTIFPESKTKADKWISDVKNAISEVEKAIGTTNSTNSIYYINGEKQKVLYYSDGGNSMISRILDIANVQLATEQYQVLNVHKVSDEEMVRLNPYAMIIGGAYQNYLSDLLGESPVWSNLDCVKNERIYRIPVAMVGIENVSADTPVMIRYIASLFSDNFSYDVKEGLKSNIKSYFGYDLSESDINNMMLGLDRNGDRIVNVSK